MEDRVISKRIGWARVLGVLLLAAPSCSKKHDAGSEAAPVATATTPSAAQVGAESAKGEQYFPLQSYRVGPYAAGGTGFFGGFIDYLQLVNLRDGGVGGVKLTWSECETEYVVE